jgi:hypothetical protein
MRCFTPVSALFLLSLYGGASAQPSAPNRESQLTTPSRENQQSAQADLLVPPASQPTSRGSGLHVYMGFTCDDPNDLACVSQGLRAIRMLVDSVSSDHQTRCEPGRPDCPDQDLQIAPPNREPQPLPPAREGPNSPGERKPNWPADNDPNG